MQIWQHWMSAGNQAYFAADWPEAQHCYLQALEDVWPVWLQSTRLHAALHGQSQLLLQAQSQHLSEEELCLPTCCMVVTVRNLACCYRSSGQSARSRALLRQSLHWLICALEQHNLPAVLQTALLSQQADVLAELQRCHSCALQQHSCH